MDEGKRILAGCDDDVHGCSPEDKDCDQCQGSRGDPDMRRVSPLRSSVGVGSLVTHPQNFFAPESATSELGHLCIVSKQV